MAATVLYAGVWPLAFLLPENSEGDPKAAAELVFSATFVYLIVLAIAVGHMIAGRREKRSGGQATAAASARPSQQSPEPDDLATDRPLSKPDQRGASGPCTQRALAIGPQRVPEV